MRLYTFEREGTQHLGVEHKGRLADLPAAYQALVKAQGATRFDMPSDMLSFIRMGIAATNAAKQVLSFLDGAPAASGIYFDMDKVKLHAPLPRPGKILCSGINYASHAEDNPNAIMPTKPMVGFAKMPSNVIGPFDSIIYPKLTQQLDWEVELAAIIGETIPREVTENEVVQYVAGYTIFHDVSARDVQNESLILGKNFDTFAPMGPCMVTTDELTDPYTLQLKTLVNGVVKQNANNRDWLFPLPKMLCRVANVMTLYPGDVVTMGTPGGTGLKDGKYLKVGDVVRMEIDGIGHIENRIVAPA
ncbi:MAG TPA: fumarylacetoacetate hydrolase family protein [Anaerolineae bacterium]|nr:fumarylacetoacetate hydrolase family protein [Anaerolineae bacterium]